MGNKVALQGLDNYVIDDVTYEIFNKRGTRMRPSVDIRGAIRYKLVKDDGVQTTRTLRSIVMNTLQSEDINVEEVAILPQVMVAYYEVYPFITPDMNTFEVAKMISKVASDVHLSDIGKILRDIGH